MRGHAPVALAGLAVVGILAGCGGGSHPVAAPPTTSAAATTTVTQPSAAAAFRVTIQAPTHRPKPNAKWPVTIRVTNAAGTPIAAVLRMQILYGGTPVGQVDNGRVYHVVGSWREKPGQEITWPAAAAGQALTFQALVTVHGQTKKVDYTIRVRG